MPSNGPGDNPKETILRAAEGVANGLNDHYVTVDHALVALLKDSSVRSFLSTAGIDLVTMDKMAAKQLEKPGADKRYGRGDSSKNGVYRDPALEKALALAERYTSELQTRYSGVNPKQYYARELIVALLDDPKASQPLHFLRLLYPKADPVAKFQEVIDLHAVEHPGAKTDRNKDNDKNKKTTQGEYQPMATEWKPRSYTMSKKEKEDSVLTKFSRDLTELAFDGNKDPANAKLDPLIGREGETSQVIRVLSRRGKNNPILVGEPGVGKTAIVEGLAQRIVRGDVPEELKNKTIVSLDMGSLIAGTKYRGEFEERVKGILNEIKKDPNILLYIDETHTVLGAGGAEGAQDLAQLLKPALSRGEIKMIGSTTLDEYRKYIEKDGALDRRFDKVMVDAPTNAMTKDILRGLEKKYGGFHKVEYSAASVEAAVELSNRFIIGKEQPDKAITLLDDAGTRAKLAGSKLVTVDDVKAVIAEKTGIPVGNLGQDDLASLKTLPDRLKEKVFNQDPAIEAVAKAIRLSRTGMGDPKRPVGSFIFTGPTGVGKTELAKQLGINLFGSEDSVIRFDMSEYGEKHTVSRLTGPPPGYVGYDDRPALEAVRNKPYSIVLFDEIEKAHPDVFNIFLQILDEGRVKDSQGRMIDFRNAVVIMTTNAGGTVKANAGIYVPGFNAAADVAEKRKAALKEKGMKPEFLNRVDGIIDFASLPKEAMPKVVNRIIKELKAGREGLKNLDVELTDEVVPWLVDKGFEPENGARPYKRLVDSLLANEFSLAVLDGKIQQGVPAAVHISVKPDKSGLSFVYNQLAIAPPAALPEPVNDNKPEAPAADQPKPAVG